MKKCLIYMALGTLSTFCASCTDEVPSIPDSELYTREWVKKFGVINPDQDWNAAARGSITVSTDAPAEVKITADIRGKVYLLADYKEVSGSRELLFDIPKGVEEVAVSCGGEEFRTRLGGKVSFATAGRAIWDMKTDPFEVVKFKRTEGYREISDVAVRSFGDKLKENKNNLNVEGVSQNFEFVANGPFTIYPVFWNTGRYNTLGIYYIHKDEATGKRQMVHIPFYTAKIAPVDGTQGNLLYQPYGAPDGYWVYPGSSDSEVAAQNCSYPEYSAYQELEDAGYTYQDMIDWGFQFPVKWQSRGIEFDIAAGTRFGLYLRTQVWDDNAADHGIPNRNNVEPVIFDLDDEGKPIENDGFLRLYSNSFYNKKNMVDPDGGSELLQAVHAASYMYDAPSGKTYRVLAFEDWDEDANPSVHSDRDLNDQIFFIDSESPHEIPDIKDEDEPEPEPIKWLIACEDLGGKDDFDFNDVVFEIEHVAGSGKATITPLAAGGTLETYLMRDGKKVDEREWHSLFGDGTLPYTEMINTQVNSYSAAPITISVPDDFSITSPTDVYDQNDNEAYKRSMGGFYLLIGDEERTVTPPVRKENAVAPQMILIYQPEGNPWRWPRERIAIDDAYGESFVRWMESGIFDANSEGGNWSENPVKTNYVITR